MLINQGFLFLGPDEAGPSGLFDENTRLAIVAFQQTFELDGGAPDYRFGVLDEETLACIARMNALVN